MTSHFNQRDSSLTESLFLFVKDVGRGWGWGGGAKGPRLRHPWQGTMPLKLAPAN